MMRTGIGLACALTLVGSAAMARPEVVVPNSFATTPGTSGLNTLVRDLNAPRTYQMIISGAQLSAIPAGSILTGVTWRANITTLNPPTWPPAAYNYNDYDMFIGQAALPVGSGSTTFANNVVGGTEVQVLDGPLSIAANTFTQGVLPNASPWGFFIQFDTPFTYNGGDLVFTARHPGATVVGALFLDSVASGVANGVQTFTATNATATVGGAATSTIFRFTWEVPAPGTLALLGLSGLVAIRRRR